MPESHIKESSSKLNIIVPPDPIIVFESYMEQVDPKYRAVDNPEPFTPYGKDIDSIKEKHGTPKSLASPAT
jgi:hypothetical protein